MPIAERENWRDKAVEFGFQFHTMYGQRYWDESAYYQFSLDQIENGIEAPTLAIHQMCLQVVEAVVSSDDLMRRFCIPQKYWCYIRDSWHHKEPSLYSRLDFAYDGKGPAKLYENNADTPTSVYETGFWQWQWLEENVNSARLAFACDQFNSLQEKLVNRFRELKILNPDKLLYFTCCNGSEEDRGAVQYLQDCAEEAGIECSFIYIEDIGLSDCGHFTDLNNLGIDWLFKLYPWEFMFMDTYGEALQHCQTTFLEPPWKSILSNKALLPMLWRLFPNHPNLLPAFFQDELDQAQEYFPLVKKPIFSREGANITILNGPEDIIAESDGPYGQEGFIYQAAHILPKFGDNYTLIGSWLVDNQPAGISIREDNSVITQDMSRYLPHVIID